jgi:hypothetical protein
MLLGWFKRRRRARLLAEPFPAEWAEVLRANVPYCAYLTPDQVARLNDNLRVFVAEKEWVGCAGLTVTDEMQVTIAALACLLVLEIHPTYHYDRIKSILIYPAAYRRAKPRWGFVNGVDDIADEGPVLGEAWHRSPVIFSWRDVLRGVKRPHDGQNVAFHEFAHHLDDIDGGTDGTPPLDSRAQYRRWDQVLGEEYGRHVAAARAGEPTLLDYYGAKNEAEFFAVATECFFECGKALRDEHPHLYEILLGFYHQDTAGWPVEPDERVRVGTNSSA